MNYQAVAKLDQLPVGSLRRVEIGGKTILLVRRDDGVFATEARCPHMGLPLDKGELTPDGALRCKFHHACFDPADGQVRQWANFPPGIQLLNVLRKPRPLHTYPVKVEGEDILVAVE